MYAIAGAEEIISSIIVSNLPKNYLLKDLKELMLDHFSNFGTVVRISCATKGKLERTAHLQFSSQNEAQYAKENGTFCNGHALTIALTKKAPTTQILPPRIRRNVVPSQNYIQHQPPTPQLKTTVIHAQPLKSGGSAKISQQSTIDAFIRRDSSPKPGPSNFRLALDTNQNAKNQGSSPSSNLGNAPSASTHASTDIDRKPKPPIPNGQPVKQEKKPKVNTCVKMEVFKGSPFPSSQPLARSQSVHRLNTLEVHNSLRPFRSLSEIMNLDTTRMRKVKIATASDALAFQYFGSNFPFSLPMMFGRPPGNVIMPTSTVMNQIKPGMEISNDAQELVWNQLLGKVLTQELPQLSRKAYLEVMIDETVSKIYSDTEEPVVGMELEESASRETGFEEDVWIICEDVLEEQMGLVIKEELELLVGEEIRANKVVSKLLECCYRKVLGVVLKDTVTEAIPEIVKDVVCEEAVDDFLDSFFFKAHIKIIAQDAFKQCQEQGMKYETSDVSPSESSFETPNTTMVSPASIPDEDQGSFMERWFRTSAFDIHEDSNYTDLPDIPSDVDSDTDSSTSSESQHDHYANGRNFGGINVGGTVVTATTGNSYRNADTRKEINGSTQIDQPRKSMFGTTFSALKRRVISMVSPERFFSRKKPKMESRVSETGNFTN